MTDTRPLAELTLVEASLRYVPVVVSFIASTTDTLVFARPDATRPPPPLMG